MENIGNILLLSNKIPIRLIKEPFCKICMNPVSKEEDYCRFCIELPLDVDDWYFNRIISIGSYKTYENRPYNNIPLNNISRTILILKGNIKKQKKRIGQILADGLYYMIKKYPFLLQDESYLIIPPKNDSSEENQCLYFLNPLIKILNKEGYNIKDLSSKINRISNIGKNRDKPTDIRFKDIKGVHKLDDVDLDGKNILILDDVVTSKSTIWDISRELKEKNAGEINVLSIGRTLLSEKSFMEDDVYDDLKFDELITYFSNLENILEPKKINSLNVEKCKIENNKFECKIKDYDIYIDFENLMLKHNCPDFYRRKYLNKSFCKHITKFFIDIKNKKGEEFAQQKLYSMYKFLIHWNFDYNP